jgi:hypothetical protein
VLLPAPRAALTGAVLCALALTGCSDDDGGGDGSGEGLPTAPVTITSSSPSASVTTITPSPLPSITLPGTPAPTTSAPATVTAPPSTEAPVDPLTPRPPLETAPPTGQPLCDSQDLTVVDADAIIDATAVRELFVVRTSGPDCQLTGYPTVQLRDARGAVLPATYRPGGFGLPNERPAPHTLSKGTSISFVVATGRTGASCREAATIRVRLPGTSALLTTTTAFRVCDEAVGLSPLRRQLDIE